MGRDGQSVPLHALVKRKAVPWWHDDSGDLYIVCLGWYGIWMRLGIFIIVSSVDSIIGSMGCEVFTILSCHECH